MSEFTEDEDRVAEVILGFFMPSVRQSRAAARAVLDVLVERGWRRTVDDLDQFIAEERERDPAFRKAYDSDDAGGGLLGSL